MDKVDQLEYHQFDANDEAVREKVLLDHGNWTTTHRLGKHYNLLRPNRPSERRAAPQPSRVDPSLQATHGRSVKGQLLEGRWPDGVGVVGTEKSF